jgi:hypothetical protein
MVDNTRMFDWLAYEAVVDMLYNVDVNKQEELMKVDVKPLR